MSRVSDSKLGDRRCRDRSKPKEQKKETTSKGVRNRKREAEFEE
jgi:hypothetical protein